MQLVYFWIEEYGILKEEGINFNSGFYFEMKKDNSQYILERKKEKEKKIPGNFFGEGIENISCIIGENGSGKTTLIRSIINSKHGLRRHNIVENYLMIFENNGKFYIEKDMKNIKFHTNIKTSEDKYIRPKYVYFNTEISKTPINYITNVLDISLVNDIYKSVVGKETNKKEIIEEKITVIGSEILAETERKKQFRRIEFLSEKKEIIEKIPYIEFKKKLQDIHRKKKISMKLKSEINISYEYNEKDYDIFFNKLGKIEENIYGNFINILWKYICLNLSRNNITKELKNFLKEKMKTKENENIFSWIKENLDIIKEKESGELSSKGDIGWYEQSLIKLSDIYGIERLIESFKNLNKEIEVTNNKEIKITIDMFNKIFYKNVNIANKIFDYYLGIGFSNGEEIFLDFFIKLYGIRGTIEANGELESVILFLEELESFMHPEWQRKVVDFLSFLKNNIPWMKNIDVQVILVSHTPFLIGDIPGGNISYFKEGEIMRNEYETFGGNIYNILKEQFLMESCFGEFSKEKIKKVVNLLSKDENNNYKEIEIENNKEEIEFVIDSIGEDLIRNKLKKMYDNYKEYKKNSRQKIKSGDIEEIRKFIENKGLLVDDVVNELK